MDISTAFTFMKNDKEWITKVLIAGLIGLIPIIGQFYITGWGMEITKRYLAGRSDLLPETQFGLHIKMGFKAAVVAFVYTLPATLISSFSAFIIDFFSSSNSEAMQFFGAAMSCISGFLAFLLGLVISVFVIAAYMRLIDTGLWKDAFDFAAVWKMVKSSPKTLIILLLLQFLTSLISGLGVVVCFIGLIFTMPYGISVFSHLIGQGKIEIDQAVNPL